MIEVHYKRAQAMTPKRLEQIRFHFKDSPDEAVAGELFAEIDRMHAAVEKIKGGLITYDAELGGYTEGGPFVYLKEVLEALGIE